MSAHRKPPLAPVSRLTDQPSADSLAAVRRGVRSIKLTAIRLGVCPRTVRDLCADGVLDSFLVGRKRMVTVVSISEYLARQRDQYRGQA